MDGEMGRTTFAGRRISRRRFLELDGGGFAGMANVRYRGMCWRTGRERDYKRSFHAPLRGKIGRRPGSWGERHQAPDQCVHCLLNLSESSPLTALVTGRPGVAASAKRWIRGMALAWSTPAVRRSRLQ